MDKIKDVKMGQSLPPERWMEAAENLDLIFQRIACNLQRMNVDGRGKQDAQEFMAEAMMAITAMKFVAAFHTEDCRFIFVPGKKG